MSAAGSRGALAADLVEAMAGAYQADARPPAPWPGSRMTRADFLALARRVLAHQAENNADYARYAARLGVDLAGLDDPLDAPPVPTDAFKRLRLSTFDPAEAVACFRSSGTTQADRSEHLFRTLAPMRASIEPPFLRYVLPDLAPGATMPMVVLAPTPAQAPDSSLYFMLGHVRERFGRAGGRAHFFAADLRLDAAAVCRALEDLAGRGEPVLLLGPSFAYVHLFDRSSGFRVTLPPGSRLFETGGFKGRSREVPRAELHAMFADRLGLDPARIVGEYGMSELSSQLYEPCLRRSLAGAQDAARDAWRVYVPPPWCAVRVLDPVSLAPVPVGQPGLVAFFDLANLDSVSAVVTGDLGTLVPAGEPGDAPPGWHGLPAGCRGLALHGRAAGASAKGCSLAMDMLLSP